MKKIIIAIFALCLLNSCEKESLDLSSDEFNSSELKSSELKSSSETFKATFFTETDLNEDVGVHCNKAEIRWYQAGNGTETNLGDFTTKMNFCMDEFPTPGGVDEEGNTYDFYYPYRVVKGSFFFADDRLDFIVPVGEVRINYLGYLMWWDDTFIFTGGTGRFKGASGRGTTMANSTDGVRNNHNWTGEIRLVKKSV